jgi:hypothetical protein
MAQQSILKTSAAITVVDGSYAPPSFGNAILRDPTKIRQITSPTGSMRRTSDAAPNFPSCFLR